MSTRIVRCSSLDSLFACTPSVVGDDGEVRVNGAGDEAETGKAVHALASSFVRAGTFDLKSECLRRGIADEEEVAKLIGYACRAWEEICRFFPTPKTERAVESLCLATRTGDYKIVGTADVLSGVGESDAIFADWKTGFIDDGYHQQMTGYAYCVWTKLGRPKTSEITGIVAFLRHRYYRVVRYSASMLEEWEHDLCHNVLSRVEYRPGKQCVFCPIRHSCKAQQAMVNGTLQTLMHPADLPAEHPTRAWMDKAAHLIGQITPENKTDPLVGEVLGDLRFKLKLARRVVDDAEELIRQAVARAGPIPLDNGFELALRDVAVRTLDPEKAWKVLQQHLSTADVLAAIRMSLPKLLAAKAAKFRRGAKKEAREQLEKDLEAAGALHVATQQRLEEVDLTTEVSRVATAIPTHQSQLGDAGEPTGADPGHRQPATDPRGGGAGEGVE